MAYEFIAMWIKNMLLFTKQFAFFSVNSCEIVDDYIV